MGKAAMKILIIEDDEGLNRGLSFTLSQEGYEVAAAASAGDGLGLFEKENPGDFRVPCTDADGQRYGSR